MGILWECSGTWNHGSDLVQHVGLKGEKMKIEGFKKRKRALKNVILYGITAVSIAVILICMATTCSIIGSDYFLPWLLAFGASSCWLVAFSNINADRW